MSSMLPKVLVVGGGTMGLASAWALARRGFAVELFERFGHVHAHGSHGGYTRIIRHAYHEGSDYVGLVSRADREWTALADRCGEDLLIRCGLFEFGPADDPEFAAARAALREHAIAHELLDPRQARARFGFAVPERDDWLGCLSPDSGYLRVVACLDALRREAEDAGARLRHGAAVRELVLGGERPEIVLEDGQRIVGDRVVLACGAWTSGLLGSAPARVRSLGLETTVLRRVLAWTRAPEPVRARLRRLPAWAAFVPEGFFYGFPDNDEGICGFKLACHVARDEGGDAPVDPDHVDRTVHDLDVDPLRGFLARYRPDAGTIVEARVCLYTNTPSGDFWVDHHPEDPRCVIAAGFSGHGFKFAPAIGLAVAQLLEHGRSELQLARFRRAAHAPPQVPTGTCLS
jgi:monomeric sarcosine oxidase